LAIDDRIIESKSKLKVMREKQLELLEKLDNGCDNKHYSGSLQQKVKEVLDWKTKEETIKGGIQNLLEKRREDYSME